MSRRRFYQTTTEDLGNGVTNRTVKSRGYFGPYNPPGDGKYLVWILLVAFMIMWPWMLGLGAAALAIAIPWYAFVAIVTAAVRAKKP